ncbi:uncharacterized protein N7496_002196 [Penicillium cataractarum]|uniref:Uncharacterized protein n=1 Tax=Penicillium cataractarum TaxID=2100454 RepID=A0A9W9SNR8_9EURO|nr:uncharacterized protein N7496_002196 [Penicillium cataractarum]KAJ5379768.1 hypothetical protein N7496_002196 [Penicillium cataractarum]
MADPPLRMRIPRGVIDCEMVKDLAFEEGKPSYDRPPIGASKDNGTAANVTNNTTTKAAGVNWLIGPVIASKAFVNARRKLVRTYNQDKHNEDCRFLHTGPLFK